MTRPTKCGNGCRDVVCARTLIAISTHLGPMLAPARRLSRSVAVLSILLCVLAGCASQDRHSLMNEDLGRFLGAPFAEVIGRLGLVPTSGQVLDEPPYAARAVEFETENGRLTLVMRRQPPMFDVDEYLARSASQFRSEAVVGIRYRQGRLVRDFGEIPVGWQVP